MASQIAINMDGVEAGRRLTALGAVFVGTHGGEGCHPEDAEPEPDAATGKTSPGPSSLSWARLQLVKALLALRMARALPKVMWTLLRHWLLLSAALGVALLAAQRSSALLRLLRGPPAQRWRLLAGVLLLDAGFMWELRALRDDPVHAQTLDSSHSGVDAGLFVAKNHAGHPGAARMTRILARCGGLVEQLGYKSPRWLCNGDMRTVMPTVAYSKTKTKTKTKKSKSKSTAKSIAEEHGLPLGPLQYQRYCIPSRTACVEPHGITLDFSWAKAIPKAAEDVTVSKDQEGQEKDQEGQETGAAEERRRPRARRMVLMMAGVGGDSDAPYVRDAVEHLNAEGWPVCVLLARGLGGAVPVRDVRSVFDPATAATDVVDAMQLLHELVSPSEGPSSEGPASEGAASECAADRPGCLVLAGFSLGAITICNVLGRHGAPASVAGAVALSGGFKCDMLDWPRYEAVYQPLIVPKLLGSIAHRYGEGLGRALDGAQAEALFASKTYSELYRHFFAQLASAEPGSESAEGPGGSGSGTEGGFQGWKASQEGFAFRRNVQVPLLFVSALDDPLHHPSLIGVETDEALFDSPNVAYLLTQEGGHVGWPERAWPSDFGFMNNLINTFADACAHEHEHEHEATI